MACTPSATARAGRRPIEDIMQKFVGRFREKKPDWAAFEDARSRATSARSIASSAPAAPAKHGDPTVIPARTSRSRSCMWSRGKATPRTTHEVEECFFVLQGYLDVFVEDEDGKRLTTPAWPLGMHLVPGRRDPRLSDMTARAGLFPGHSSDAPKPRPWLRRRGTLQKRMRTSRRCDGPRLLRRLPSACLAAAGRGSGAAPLARSRPCWRGSCRRASCRTGLLVSDVLKPARS